MEILTTLNDKQKQAVEAVDGPVLVIAGPGSGKTLTLTKRIVYLIQQGISPKNILAVTFTNKAAGEMKERINNLMRSQESINSYQAPTTGTFHAICLRVLRLEIDKLGYKKNFAIYDQQDQMSLVKDVLKELQIKPEQFKPATVLDSISRAKDELIDTDAYKEQAFEFFPKTISKIYDRYQASLKKANALDFDDIIMLTVNLFRKYPKILAKYQEKWKHILVDEYQDTSHAQYTLISLLSQKYRNIYVVGDDWQCLPGSTKINTPTGPKAINRLKKGNTVLSASGKTAFCQRPIAKIRKFSYQGPIIKIKTKSNKTISLTPNHLIFLRLSLKSNIYYVYLMLRKDKGYRLGIAQGSRRPTKSYVDIGLRIRSAQENADKIWILRICKSRGKANYWELYYAFKYGIPTTVFFTAGRKMLLSQKDIDKLYQKIDTQKKAKILMKDLLLNEEYPHFSPQGVTKKNITKRIKMRVTLFSDNRKTDTSPWGLSRVSINSSDKKLRNTIEKLGFKTRKGKRKDWVAEIARVDYGAVERIAMKIKEEDDRIDITKTALLTDGKRFIFQPASQAHPSMIIPVKEKNKIVEEEIAKVEKIPYQGKVYDLDIDQVHNYLAQGFVVHNSIYSWRGADFRNILNFEKDYPDAKIVFLDQNYRSTKNIVEASHNIIIKNKERIDKKLWTENEEGHPIQIIEAADEREEGDFLAMEIENLLSQGLKLSDFTVLYRTNAQSRAIEEAFLKANYPYRIIGTVKFYDRKEIKDILAYLKFILNEHDFISLQRIINLPPRRLARFQKQPAADLLDNKDPVLEDFFKLIDQMRLQSKQMPLTKFIKYLISKIDYEKYVLSDAKEGERRWENVQEIFTVTSKFDKIDPLMALQSFLEEVSLMSSPDEIESNKELINLMTVHCAKGLEFPVVFIVGCEEGVFPHSKSFLDNAQMEEERRLFYVGLTRAKQRAYLSFAQQRRLFGSIMTNPPSRFIADLPAELTEYHEASY